MALSQTFLSFLPSSLRRFNLKNLCSKAFFAAVILYIFASTIFIIDKVSYDKRSKSYHEIPLVNKAEQPSSNWIPSYLKNIIRKNVTVPTKTSTDAPRCGYQVIYIFINLKSY